jgi:hypothetical protein
MIAWSAPAQSVAIRLTGFRGEKTCMWRKEKCNWCRESHSFTILGSIAIAFRWSFHERSIHKFLNVQNCVVFNNE